MRHGPLGEAGSGDNKAEDVREGGQEGTQDRGAWGGRRDCAAEGGVTEG